MTDAWFDLFRYKRKSYLKPIDQTSRIRRMISSYNLDNRCNIIFLLYFQFSIITVRTILQIYREIYQDLSLISLSTCVPLYGIALFSISTLFRCLRELTKRGYKRQSALAHGHFWHSCTLGVFFSSRHRTACYLVKVEQYAIFQAKVAGLCNRVCGRSRGRERWMRSFRTVWKIISLPSNENKPDTPRPPFLPRARKRTIGLVNHCRSISSRSSGAKV